MEINAALPPRFAELDSHTIKYVENHLQYRLNHATFGGASNGIDGASLLSL